MTVFVADHTGGITTRSAVLRPIHIGAALGPPGETGPEPDTTVPDSLSAMSVYADLRLYDYIGKAHAGEDFVAIHQHRRHFFFGEPERWQWRVAEMKRMAEQAEGGQVEIPHDDLDVYLEHLSRLTDLDLSTELGGHTIIANQWSFGHVTVEKQYLSTIAQTYPEESAYLDAWYDLRSVLEAAIGPDTVGIAVDATTGYFNNCFVTSWDEFDRYRAFLFEVLDELDQYQDVYRLFGYLAERIFTVYLAHQIATRPGFSVQSRPMMLFV